MNNKILFKRGLLANLPALDSGEPAITTDSNDMYFGSPNGNIKLSKKKDVDLIVVNVKDYGAKGDGATDDTQKIQSAIDYVASIGGGVVLVPNGTYMVKADNPNTTTTDYLRDEGGIALKDNVTLQLQGNAILKALTSNMQQYQVVRIVGRTNVKVTGGTIQGERDTHIGSTGEWGYGIGILGSKNVEVNNVKIINCWGDGLNIQVGADNSASSYCENIRLINLICDSNRRDGMAIEGVKGCYIRGCTFSNTSGVQGEHGVDIEPWDNAIPCERITFFQCVFDSNNGAGVQIMMANTRDILFDRCKFINNKDATYHQGQLKTHNNPSQVRVVNCLFDKGVAGCNLAIEFRNVTKAYAINNLFLNNGMSVMRDSPNTVQEIFIKDNHFKLNAFDYDYPLYTTDSESYLYIEGNLFDMMGNTGVSGGYIQILGTTVKVKNNKFLRIKHGVAITSSGATVEGNEFHICDYESAVLLGNSMNFVRNIISGSCHTNDLQACIRVLTGSDYATIKDNVFFQKALVDISGTGSGYAGSAIELASNVVRANVYNNTAVPVDDSHTIDLIRSNYTGNGNNIEKGATSQRPAHPTISQQFYDVTLLKPIWWNGSAWKDASGNTV